MENLVSNLLPLLFTAFGIAYILFFYSRSKSILKKWAVDNGYKILHDDLRLFMRGPYFWTASRGQTVYYVHVRDHAGNERRGYVRCGDWILGILCNRADVRWDDKR